ncbi:MAG: DoxX family membrane protein [Patescibacteria group bacterium]|nr:DoxX family membrane protein [Patescibacteria group bacterium]MDE2437951.1 DoxX family membrane protein [Patescibacteria group bacterium]
MTMKKFSFHVLRIGLGITFTWIGILIVHNPVGWGSYLQPWAARLVPFPLIPAMVATGFVDMIIGALLVLNQWTWLASLMGALQLVIVLVCAGITDVTVRDIGLLAASFALAASCFDKNN